MPTRTNTKNTSSEVELINLVINPSVDKERSSCWEECFSSQFPTGSMIEKNGMYIVQVGAPHEGYTIETHLLNNKMHGKSNLYSNEDLLMAELTFEEGVAEGPCTLYDTANLLFFEGYFKNGYRSGKGKEYDREGNVIFDGYFYLGKRLYINQLNEMSGYWKEYDEKGRLLNISARNAKSGEKEGICYYYDENDEISHIVEVKEGVENEYNGYCKLYDEPHKTWLECFCVRGKRRMNLIRLNEMEGYWKEYDENGRLLNISARNAESGEKEGICYYYNENDKISHIVEVKEGIENEYNGYCKLYDDPHKSWFEGFVKNGRRMNLIRSNEMEGYWKEYDEKGKLLNISARNGKSGEKEGICYYYDENGNMSHIVEVKEGIEKEYNGYCKLYDEPHKSWFEGFVENGIRHGKGKEYDSLKNEVTEVFFDDGKKLKIEIDNKNKGYRKEYDEQDHLVSICKRDENGRFYGICYRYDANGKISRISEWKDGKETTLIKTFNGNYMVEYINGVKYYEGEFMDSLNLNYIRSGQGKEFDANGRSVIYQGSWFNGKRHGKGTSFQNRKRDYDGEWINGRKKKEYYTMIWGRIAACIGVIVILIVVSFFIKVWLGIAFSVLLLILLVLCARWYFCQIRCGLDYQMAKVLHRPNLKFGNRCCKLTKEFSPPLYVESIEIGNECFGSVKTFKIDGLNQLKTIKIGNKSFTQKKNDCPFGEKSKSFHILNCESLESIQIGRYSFSDFGGEFELKNLPQLQSIQIGTIESYYSYNFCFSSFVIRGIEMILNI